MKIALFTETYLPYINGVVTHVKTLKEGLEAEGHEVLIVTADYKARRHYITSDHVLHCPAIRAKKFYGYSLAKPVSFTRYKLIKQFCPDIIHIHDEFGVCLSGIAAAKMLKVPLVYTLHTMYDQYLYYISPKALMPFTQRLSHLYARFIADKASAITGPSQKCQVYLEGVGIDSPVTVIPNAVELDMFEKAEGQQEQICRLKKELRLEGKTVFCFVGRLGREKSVDKLLDFLAQEITPEDNMVLMVIGGGPVQKELEEQAERLGVAPFVRFTGAVPHEKLSAYYRCCRGYITASISDTNSISMKEAMASGLPVLHIHDPLNAGQIVNGVNGFIYHDAEELAAGIRRLRDMSGEELEALRKSTLQSVEAFSQEALAKKLLAVYFSVL